MPILTGRKKCRETLALSCPYLNIMAWATKSVGVHSFLPTIFRQQRCGTLSCLSLFKRVSQEWGDGIYTLSCMPILRLKGAAKSGGHGAAECNEHFLLLSKYLVTLESTDVSR